MYFCLRSEIDVRPLQGGTVYNTVEQQCYRGPSNVQCFCIFHKGQQVLWAYGEEPVEGGWAYY